MFHIYFLHHSVTNCDIPGVSLTAIYLFQQVKIINDLPEDKTIIVYRCGPLVDLCRGPHIPNTSFVKAFCCLKVRFGIIFSGCRFYYFKIYTEIVGRYIFMPFYLHHVKASSAYWKRKQDRESLQRVYGISFSGQEAVEGKFQCFFFNFDWRIISFSSMAHPTKCFFY